MMACHALRMILAGMEGLHLAYASFRVNDRTASVSFDTDEDARAMAAGFGLELREMRAGDSAWLSITAAVDGVGVVIAGPMRKVAQLEAVP